jgi:transcriptional regulator with XRE-family HTH domain
MISKESLYGLLELITSGQIRAARALLRWTAIDLANKSGVGSATIKRMEVMDGVPTGNIKTLMALKAALESAGVVFYGSPEHQPGVYLNLDVSQR